ncbi:uncharacterized protein LOC132723684 [Ruditapes philippinarum]|uniref:uncharacterized protein LOC132723684 n=1 Tax=Ruditapes philippinarum TaxID=129788 RepID=UPI00295AE8CE|nr:uncharacterized protein LOC132723684 [Ruditapes philippinarum]
MEVDKELETELRHYPSNFDLYDEVQLMSKDYIQKIKAKLVNELESSPYDTAMETIRAWNLISFLCFILGNEEDAFEYNSKVLKGSKDNATGLCNKAWFLLKMQEQYSVIKELCKQVNGLIKNEVDLLFAKAEKAFCYSRFGINRYEKSRKLFEEVLGEIHEQNLLSGKTDDSEQQFIQIDNYCVWNFGYALTFRRALNWNNAHDGSSFDLSKKAHIKVCDLYSRIIHLKGNSECLKRYQARSYVELGSLIYSVRENKDTFPNGIKNVLPEHQDLWLKTNEFYIKANYLCPNDVFVLEKCGKHFRYKKNLGKSISFLKQALAIRETAFSHHHLALSLKRQLESKRQQNYPAFANDNREEIKVKKNLASKFEQVESHLQPPKPEKYLTSTCTSQSNASNCHSKTIKKQNYPQMRLNNMSSLSDQYVPPEEIQNFEFRSNTTSKMNVEIPTNLSDHTDIEQACDMLKNASLESGCERLSIFPNVQMNDCDTEDNMKCLSFKSGYETLSTASRSNVQMYDCATEDNTKCLSLDSDYGTMSYSSNVSMNEYDAGTSMKPIEGNASAKAVNADFSFKVETMRPHNNNNHNRRNRGRRSFNQNYSSIKQHFQATSESRYGYNGRNDAYVRSGARGKRKPNRYFRNGSRSGGRAAINDKMAFMKMIKSPLKPQFIDEKQHTETIKQIIYHLDKSVELSNNSGAIYDKGMLYRQIGEYDKALSTFKILIRNEGGHCSLVQLSNAFEQSGLCLYDILSQSDEENHCKEDDMRTYFKKSIEISCSIVSKIPFLKDCWVSAPTLKEFLSGQAKTTEHLKDLFFLSKKFENYGEAIKILKDLKELTADENERTKLDIQLVENYLSNGNYDDALLALDAIVCLQNGYEHIDEKMYLQAHIEGGIVALKQKSFVMARLRLRNALDFYRHNQNVHDNEGHENDTNTEDENFDVFILCNENLEEKCMSLVHILTAFELRVTINFQELLPGTSKMSGICRQFRHSKHFLLVIDEKQLKRIDEHYFEMMQEVVLNRNYGHILIIKTSKDAKVPSHLSKYPSMEMNVGADEVPENCFENEGLCETIKALLIKLASSKQAA